MEVGADSDTSFPFRKISTITKIITDALYGIWMKSARLRPKCICISWAVPSFLPFNVVISTFKLSVAFVIYFRRKLSLQTLTSRHVSQLLQITSAFIFNLPAPMVGEQKENFARILFHMQFKVAIWPGLEQVHARPIRVWGHQSRKRSNVESKTGGYICRPQILDRATQAGGACNFQYKSELSTTVFQPRGDHLIISVSLHLPKFRDAVLQDDSFFPVWVKAKLPWVISSLSKCWLWVPVIYFPTLLPTELWVNMLNMLICWSYKPEKVKVNEAVTFHIFSLLWIRFNEFRYSYSTYSSFYSNKALDSLRKLCMKWNIFKYEQYEWKAVICIGNSDLWNWPWVLASWIMSVCGEKLMRQQSSARPLITRPMKVTSSLQTGIPEPTLPSEWVPYVVKASQGPQSLCS